MEGDVFRLPSEVLSTGARWEEEEGELESSLVVAELSSSAIIVPFITVTVCKGGIGGTLLEFAEDVEEGLLSN